MIDVVVQIYFACSLSLSLSQTAQTSFLDLKHMKSDVLLGAVLHRRLSEKEKKDCKIRREREREREHLAYGCEVVLSLPPAFHFVLAQAVPCVGRVKRVQTA